MSDFETWNSTLQTTSVAPRIATSTWGPLPIPVSPSGYQMTMAHVPNNTVPQSQPSPSPVTVTQPRATQIGEKAEGNGSSEDKPVIGKKSVPAPLPLGTHEKHITILEGTPPLYQCNICNRKFKTRAHTKYHEFCLKGEKPFQCQQCGQGFITRGHFDYHLKTHSREWSFVCSKCGKGFNQRKCFKKHIRTHDL